MSVKIGERYFEKARISIRIFKKLIMFTLIPTTRNGQALYYQQHLYNKLKPPDPLTGLTIWRCKFYQDPEVKCKTLLKATNDEVISINREHEKMIKQKIIRLL